MFSAKAWVNSKGKMRCRRMLPFILLPALVFVLVAASPNCWAEKDDDEMPFAVANLYFELNNTDGDLGIHSLIDGEPWRRLKIEDPMERNMLDIKVKGRLKSQGLTELFFESAEPPFDELSPEVFFSRFPEGEYEISGITLEEDELESIAILTHVMPAPAENITVSGIEAAEDCDVDPIPVIAENEPVVIRWDPVTQSHPDLGRTGERIIVVKYEFVLEREEPTHLKFSIDLPPDVTEFIVSEDFTSSGEAYKFEILVREESGNQTAVESCFEIE